jgi:hypothetical protein
MVKLSKDQVSMIDEIIDKFNFERVHIAMSALDWQWQTTGNNGHELPSIPRLKAMARHLLTESTTEKTLGSGGFQAEYHLNLKNKQEYYQLKFILCEADSFDD